MKHEKLKGAEIGDEGGASTIEEASAALIEKMSNLPKENLNTMTDISNDAEILRLSVIKTVAEKYKIELLSSLINEILELKVSLKREGRREMVNMVSTQINNMKDMGFKLMNRFKVS